MILETGRLTLRRWRDSDAPDLYEFASDPAVGPIAGWPAHRSVDESSAVIKLVFKRAECYAICERGADKAIGMIELKLKGHNELTSREDECELGYWLGKPFWGKGYMTEAAVRMLRRAFEELGMRAVWCGYYDGNTRSKRVQEKAGFLYSHTLDAVPVPLLKTVRTEHINHISRERWEELRSRASRAEAEF